MLNNLEFTHHLLGSLRSLFHFYCLALCSKHSLSSRLWLVLLHCRCHSWWSSIVLTIFCWNWTVLLPITSHRLFLWCQSLTFQLNLQLRLWLHLSLPSLNCSPWLLCTFKTSNIWVTKQLISFLLQKIIWGILLPIIFLEILIISFHTMDLYHMLSPLS